MTEQCYYIGIDMDDRNAVISYYKAGMREPETLSTIAGSEIYQIPVALIKKRGIGQWFIGEEAKKMALIQNEDVIGHLLDNALAKKQVTVENIVYEAEELFALYIKKLLLLASRLGNPGLPDCLVITVEALSRELTELFGKVAEDLGLGRSQLILQDRKESFYYFVYNQKPIASRINEITAGRATLTILRLPFTHTPVWIASSGQTAVHSPQSVQSTALTAPFFQPATSML